MADHLEVPQTPHAKRRFDDSDDDDIIDRLPSMDEVRNKKTGPSLLGLGGLRSLTVSPFSEHGQVSPAPLSRGISPIPPIRRPETYKTPLSQAWARFWGRNRGVVLVAFAQVFGALMNLSARLLMLDGTGMHPFQILFARMGLTTILACIYMYWKKVPNFPLGPKEVRGLLVARGLTGFFGIYPMWVSMMYLPLAEATVITFLAPSLSGYICHILLKDHFTRREQLASFIALGGVILIARPTSLFDGSGSDSSTTPPTAIAELPGNFTQPVNHMGDEPTATGRLIGIGVAIIGVLGASGAFTTIRWIGKRAHPLISVTYFSTWCTIVSSVALILAPILNIAQPEVRFGMPASAYQWALLLSLGVSGFIMQFMLTAGLGGEKSNRATAMVYTHMLFAAGFDKWVFGHEMSVVSVVGCGLIVGSALWAALAKKEQEKTPVGDDVEQSHNNGVEMEEGVPMLFRGHETDEDNEDEDAIPLRRVR
ncbi:hypothetical protein B0H63DRAFT_163868 [Podospora didyma]|uniref:EamA domain-containing protein n=1 Tax=Podospora didyma TaxID=330526 RepID=A0AAE0NUJ4_9PEZI|nr:hypothetical protein B0H63DRAFT_163868 [Podospora didyma]